MYCFVHRILTFPIICGTLLPGSFLIRLEVFCMLYSKDLKETVKLRLSSRDLDFLKELAAVRKCSVGECVRSMIGEYRRAQQTMEAVQAALSGVSAADDFSVDLIDLSADDLEG